MELNVNYMLWVCFEWIWGNWQWAEDDNKMWNLHNIYKYIYIPKSFDFLKFMNLWTIFYELTFWQS